jgi:general stress protein 26
MHVDSFSEIEEEFRVRVNSSVWCNMATIDGAQRPYSRIIHPIWERSTGWVLTHRDSHKAKQLARNPHVSLSYIRGDIQKPVYVDCGATWEDDLREKGRVWDLVSGTAPPLGFDPTPDFESPANPRFGLLKLTPWRIVLVTFPAASYDLGHKVWRA